ncbi:YqhR family membrane protein [Bacillus horti]|uniref:Succinate dehydrogenase hydrophobic anchor subunit n=1 Tax=Caldalkalibacillus horti TaxID=77523 RepID=A0ABT9W0Y4_9BACI|nr:YqhR family membrane protein [Bacillus horti]MDQ0166891.1 succinate dehydrogenase hydrophobic anchor subunit [Bacillus horti]
MGTKTLSRKSRSRKRQTDQIHLEEDHSNGADQGIDESEESSDKRHHHENRAGQTQRQKKQLYTVTVGFFGGLFASLITYLAHALNFISFGPGVVWQHLPFTQGMKPLMGPLGHGLSILCLSLLSILASSLYYTLFRKLESPWIGIWFGLSLWVLLFLGLNSLISGAMTFQELGFTTNIIFICIFAVYGLFVGYSISYQYLSDSIEKERETNS